jgi:hypothetical protein
LRPHRQRTGAAFRLRIERELLEAAARVRAQTVERQAERERAAFDVQVAASAAGAPRQLAAREQAARAPALVAQLRAREIHVDIRCVARAAQVQLAVQAAPGRGQQVGELQRGEFRVHRQYLGDAPARFDMAATKPQREFAFVIRGPRPFPRARGWIHPRCPRGCVYAACRRAAAAAGACRVRDPRHARH